MDPRTVYRLLDAAVAALDLMVVTLRVLQARTPVCFVGAMLNSTDENDRASKEVKWQMSLYAFEAADAQG